MLRRLLPSLPDRAFPIPCRCALRNSHSLQPLRRLAHEAADTGLLIPELAAGITRVKGVKQLGFRSGNWLSAAQSSEVLLLSCSDSVRAKRDYAILAMLFGCGFRRSELVGLEFGRHLRIVGKMFQPTPWGIRGLSRDRVRVE